MNRIEATQFLGSFFTSLSRTGSVNRDTDLKPFFNFVAVLKRGPLLFIPLLRELSALGTGHATDKESDFLEKKLERIHCRLCRVQEELKRLDFKKAASGVSPEDFVFSQIDFSRYREIEASYFEALFPCGPDDYDETMLRKTYDLGRKEIRSLIEESYVMTEGIYKIKKETPLVLSVMRCLETSVDCSDLFTAEEINRELKSLLDYVYGVKPGRSLVSGMEKIYPLMAFSLNGVDIIHKDGMKTTIFVSKEGYLSGTFRPAGKPWTRILISGKL